MGFRIQSGGIPTGFPAANSPGNPAFFDDFNYTIDRNDNGGGLYTAIDNPIITANPNYTRVKSNQFGESGAHGWLYTVTSIPGYAGVIPGLTGGHALCFEALGNSLNYPIAGRINYTDGVTTGTTNFYSAAATFTLDDPNAARHIHVKSGANAGVYRIVGFIDAHNVTLANPFGTGGAQSAIDFDILALGQTDCYIQLGQEFGPLNAFGADIWLQAWVYEGVGDLVQTKFFYPTYDTFPRAPEQMWLLDLREFSDLPYDSYPPTGHNMHIMGEHGSSNNHLYADWQGSPYERWWRMGANDANPPSYLQGGVFKLVKIHIDISGLSQTGGIFEVWMRSMGDPNWTKTHDWTSGNIVAGSTFMWNLVNNNGPAAMRLFTTTDNDGSIYMADWAIANGVNSGGNGSSDLPTYLGY